ncbi:MAG TPA: M56 family metallopeptidase [Saprospiraceae bacterium]|nr:M56 family metallopeptidase [Saprospiraceae bacterium]
MLFTIDTNWLQTLAWTILHSLWQGALVFIFLLMYRALLPRLSSAQKFRAAYVSLISLFIIVVATFMYLHNIRINSDHDKAIAWYFQWQQAVSGVQKTSIESFINQNANYISNIWFIGFFVFALRYLLAYLWLVMQASRATQIQLPDICLDTMKIKMGITKKVVVKTSFQTGSPFTMGLFKSAIFFPIAVINALSSEEIEAILAHELAHIRRNDFILHLFAALVETILYYHPVVWWLQRQLAQYREEACDDEAMAFTQNPLAYAKALLKIQEIDRLEKSPSLSLAFAGKNNNQLLNRIKRIFHMSHTPIQIKEKLMASLAILIFAMGLTEAYAYQHEGGKYSVIKAIESKVNHEIQPAVSDSLPQVKKKGTISIIKSDGEKEISLKMENGEIKSLSINGEQIPPAEFDKHKHIIKEITTDDYKTYTLTLDDFSKGDFPFHGGDVRTFEFDFPNHGEMFQLDSLHRIFQLQGDSLHRLGKILQFEADSMHKLFLDFPHMGHNNFKFHFPEGGMHLPDMKGFKEFEIHIPEMEGWSPEDWAEKQREAEEEIALMPELGRQDHFFKRDNEKNLEQLIGSQLNRDGFLIAGKNNKIELSGKNLKINGEKQPSNIWNKYKNLFERETGMTLSKDTKLVFEIEGKESKRKYKAF